MPQTQAWLTSPSLSAASRPVCFHVPLNVAILLECVVVFITTRWQQSVILVIQKVHSRPFLLSFFIFSFYTKSPPIPHGKITNALLTLNSYCHNLQLTVWLFFCSASRFYWPDETKRCTRQPTSGKEEKRKEEECGGHGSAVPEQE